MPIASLTVRSLTERARRTEEDGTGAPGSETI
jgi:hypothetical protein